MLYRYVQMCIYLTSFHFVALVSSTEDNHTLELQPGDSSVCVHLNMSTDERLSYRVTHNDDNSIRIKNPTGVIIGILYTVYFLCLYMCVYK